MTAYKAYHTAQQDNVFVDKIYMAHIDGNDLNACYLVMVSLPHFALNRLDKMPRFILGSILKCEDSSSVSFKNIFSTKYRMYMQYSI
jgi:hypothetical protein